MVCPKCGTENKNNFCIKCGAIINREAIYQIKESSNDSSDLEKYIGNNSYAILGKNSNIAAGFFGFLYLSYRKCYFFSYLFMIMDLIFIMEINKYNNYSLIIMWLFFRFIFYLSFSNSIYTYTLKKKIRRLNSLGINDYLSGGTSLFSSIIQIIILIVFFLILYLN